MLAAIYARKSTEQTGVSDEEKSIARQIEHAKAYALNKGWTVAGEHVYSDDGISGAEFGDKRPGFARLLNALTPRPTFQALIMSEESRLGREQIRTAYALQQITEAGVRVFFYLTDQERKLDTAMDKIMGSLANFGAELEREKASQRTHDKMLQMAKAFHVTGCKVFGYDNVEILGPNGKRSHVVRRINDAEAAIVRRLFERYATGSYGLGSLAKELNSQGIPPPRGHRRGWDQSCIRTILHRELYRGVVVWNKTQAVNRGGTQTARKRPESEWLRLPHNPDLEIIPPDLWTRVHDKLAKSRVLYARMSNGRLLARPSGADMRTAYLLSGFAQCGVCGGSMNVQKRGTGHGKTAYLCQWHHNRGSTVCPNDLRIHEDTLNGAVLDALSAILDPQLIAGAVSLAVGKIRAGQQSLPDHQLSLQRQLTETEKRLGHLVEAIATGKATEAVYSELQKAEAAKKALQTQLGSVEELTRLHAVDSRMLARDLQTRVADLKGMLGRHIPQTRQVLRMLIPGRIVCTPFQDTRGKGYALSATGSYANILGGFLAVGKYGGGGQGS